MADSIELWTDSIEPVARAVAASNPRALSAEVAVISLAISAKRIADALEAQVNKLPPEPIYWSREEKNSFVECYQQNASRPLPDYLGAIASEAVSILRDRGKTP